MQCNLHKENVRVSELFKSGSFHHWQLNNEYIELTLTVEFPWLKQYAIQYIHNSIIFRNTFQCNFLSQMWSDSTDDIATSCYRRSPLPQRKNTAYKFCREYTFGILCIDSNLTFKADSNNALRYYTFAIIHQAQIHFALAHLDLIRLAE